MRHFPIKRGDWPTYDGAPAQEIGRHAKVRSAAYLGRDFPGVRPLFEVKQGEKVEIGQVLFRDRKHPKVAYVSALSGVVSTLAYGARKMLSVCTVTADDKADTGRKADLLATGSEASVRDLLLERGMWIALRTRPFGRTPTPDATPAAIFVNACHAFPQAPDPRVVLEGRAETFRYGVSLLARLTEGKVFVCQSPSDAVCADQGRIETVSFSGTIAAGFAGTHVDRLFPVRADRQVWTINYQDVIAIGHLFETGQYLSERVVSVAGAGAVRARLVRACLGGKISDICDADDGPRAIAGDQNSGHEAIYLGRFDEQILVSAKEGQKPERFWKRRRHSGPSALVPTGALEHALAPDILVVPLLRALSIGDSETAERLGCLALIEEDVSALTRLCTSGTSYGALLRHVLDELLEDAT